MDNEMKLALYIMLLTILPICIALCIVFYPFDNMGWKKNFGNRLIIIASWICTILLVKCTPVYKIYSAISPKISQEWINQQPKKAELEGYRAGDGINGANSIASINKEKYFYLDEVTQLVPTGLYGTKSPSFAGDIEYKYGGNGQKWRSHSLLFNRSRFTTNQFYIFWQKAYYSQYYVATLKDGTNIVLFLNDEQVSDEKQLKNMKLIGTVKKLSNISYNEPFTEFFEKNKEKFNLSDENTTWYIDMDCSTQMGKKTVFVVINILLTVIIFGLIIFVINRIKKKCFN